MTRQANEFGVTRETWLTVRLAKAAAALLLTICAASSHAQLVPPPLAPPPSPPAGTSTTSGATTAAPAPTPAPPPVSTPPAQSAAPPPDAPPACGWRVSPYGVPWYDTCSCHNTGNTTGTAFYAGLLLSFIPITMSTGQVALTSHCYGAYADTAQGACDLIVSQAQAIGDDPGAATPAPSATIGNWGYCNFANAGPGSLIQYRAVPNAHPTCPANMSGSPCACNAGFMPNPSGAQGCVPAYTLILAAGAATIEPWSAIRDPQHRKSNVAIVAVVVDSKGSPQPNVDLEAAADVNTDLTVYDDGHHHTGGRPRGKLLDTQSGIAGAPSTLSGATDASGMLAFYFGAEQAAGQHTVTVQCGRCTNGPLKAKINVEFAGLGRLGDDNTCHKFFCLRGGEAMSPHNHHADNHYYSTRAMYNIVMLSYYYYMEFQSDIPLAQREALLINDSSLKKGGVYDFTNNWRNPHKLHRQGIVADINNYHEEDTEFEDFAKKHSVFPSWEGPNITPTPHYHLRLLGRNRDD